jgi:hypothetical protein
MPEITWFRDLNQTVFFTENKAQNEQSYMFIHCSVRVENMTSHCKTRRDVKSNKKPYAEKIF